MRSTYMFRDQVQKVSNWFKSWNECEQTVALFSLLRKVNPTQSKFLLQVLDGSLLENAELQSLETQANNSVYICSLCQESKEFAVNQLLICLPLLRPGNTAAKTEYLKVLPLILNHSVENGCHIEESRQLLSYSLIHPALTQKERSHLSVWLSHLEERYAYNLYQQSQGCDSSVAIPPELISHHLDKISRTDNTNIAPTAQSAANNVHKSATGWQQLSCRDAGVINGNESISPTADLINALSQNHGGSGRAITSSSAVKPGMNAQHTGVDINLNSAGLTAVSHSTLQSTLSGPPAFSSVPSSQAPNTNIQSNFQVVPQYLVSHAGSINGSNTGHRKLTRSNSAITPSTAVQDSNVSEWLNRHHEEMVHNVLHTTLGVTHSEPPHAPLSPQSSVSSSGSGSEGPHEEPLPQTMRNTFLEEGSGMRDVPVWLKSLRLHKYSYLFQTMTYEDMVTLTEDWLKSQNVTKGARNKIILNTRKLQERRMCLQIMEKEIMECGNLKQALTELRSMMNTPIKAYTPITMATPIPISRPSQTDDCVNTSNSTEFSSSTDGSGGEGSGSVESSPDKVTSGVNNDNRARVESVTTLQEEPEGDLPGQITRVLGKICTQLLVSTRPEDECFSMYLQMLDKCMMHEAFTMEQKRKLLSWRQQIQKIWHPIPQRYGLDRQRKGFGNTFPPNNLLRNQRALRGQIIAKPGQPKWTFGGHPPVTLAPIGTGTGVGVPLYRNNAFTNTAFTPIGPAMVELKPPLARTHSAPIKSNAFGFALGTRPVPDMGVTEPEINARLDSLCLSMTEHALGSFTDVSW